MRSFEPWGCVIETLGQLLAVSAVVMGLSQTIAKEKIFAPLRDRLGGQDTWLGYLFSCPWCVSHWLAMALVPVVGLYPIRVAFQWQPLTFVAEWFLASILVTVVAGFFRVVFWLVDEEQGLVRRRQKRVDEETTARALMRKRLQANDQERAPPGH
jgi:hypothetical protein